MRFILGLALCMGWATIALGGEATRVAEIGFAHEDGECEDIFCAIPGSEKIERLTKGYQISGWDWNGVTSRIAFACCFKENKPGELFVKERDKAPQPILRAEGTVSDPRWNAEGTRIAFSLHNRSKVFRGIRIVNAVEIQVVDADGKNAKPLVGDGLHDWRAVWSPDGKKLAFQRGSEHQNGGLVEFEGSAIRIVDLDGSNVRKLTGAAESGFAPSWRPNGEQLAFCCGPVTAPTKSEIFVANGDGSGRKQLTKLEKGTADPVWSPDGRRLAFTCGDGGAFDVVVMDADGGNVRFLTSGGLVHGAPSWSPDGNEIVYCWRVKGGSQVHVVKTDGSGDKNLTPQIRGYCSSAKWMASMDLPKEPQKIKKDVPAVPAQGTVPGSDAQKKDDVK